MTPTHHCQKCQSIWFRGRSDLHQELGVEYVKANISVTTPTAQIAIRGTNFTTTIDELGRTLVILLPDEDGVTPSGEIDVSNEGGTITLTKDFRSNYGFDS